MKYKNHIARVEFDDEDRVFIGRLVGIDDIVTFHGSNIDDLETAFHEMVEHYLEVNERTGKVPYSDNLRLWTIEFDSDCLLALEEDMARGHIIKLAEECDDGNELVYMEKAAVGKLGGLKMQIYSNEHPPPHFHVKYNGEENSFKIDDATPLHPNGDLKKWFKNIKKWHKKHKIELVKAWNKSRPENCTVGSINC